jgi:positive regulator of sigma E activity
MIIILRGWMIVFHPWIWPLMSAFVVWLMADELGMPSPITLVLALAQIAIGYWNYWAAWVSATIMGAIVMSTL